MTPLLVRRKLVSMVEDLYTTRAFRTPCRGLVVNGSWCYDVKQVIPYIFCVIFLGVSIKITTCFLRY